MPLTSFLLCLIVGISDGDTLTARCTDQTIKIRLAEIDAPEKAQPFGQRSKQSLSDLCFEKQAEVTPQTLDRYSRTVARVKCNGVEANAEQVRRGMAWAYIKYLHDPNLVVLEREAKQSQVGLWADPEPIPPWEWRRVNAALSK